MTANRRIWGAGDAQTNLTTCAVSRTQASPLPGGSRGVISVTLWRQIRAHAYRRTALSDGARRVSTAAMPVDPVHEMKSPTLFRSYRRKGTQGRLYVGDALAFLSSLRSNSAGLVFLDPPFNLGKRYIDDDPRHDRLPQAEYYDWLVEVVEQSTRILAPGGALYVYHLPVWAMRVAAALDDQLTLRHWIAVSMKNGFVRGRNLYPAHYALLYLTKGQPASFHRPRIAATKCRHCGQTVKDYGGYANIIAEKGLNLSDVWDDLSPVRHARTKVRSENQLPLSLTDRVMAISGSPGMVMVDPFAGSGSAVVSAARHGLRFAACDIVEENCRIIDRRLDSDPEQLTKERNGAHR